MIYRCQYCDETSKEKEPKREFCPISPTGKHHWKVATGQYQEALGEIPDMEKIYGD